MSGRPVLPAVAIASYRAWRAAHRTGPGGVVWLFGLSGAGKSTLAGGRQRRLAADGIRTMVLDGDSLRQGLNRDLGFSDEDRTENIRRAAEVARLLHDAGLIVICSFITPLRRHRALAEEIIGRERLATVFVRASFAACARRDPKGLYARAASGEIPQFTGRDSGFEAPDASDVTLTIDTERTTLEACLDRLQAAVLSRMRDPS